MQDDHSARRPGGKTSGAPRAERLAAALRANLTKRKQRARKVAASERETAVVSHDDGNQGETGG